MSRAEVERHGGTGIDSGHDLLVQTAASTTPQRSEGRGRDRAWHDEAKWEWQGMEHDVAADVAQLNVGMGPPP
jgi:hypothetical protein